MELLRGSSLVFVLSLLAGLDGGLGTFSPAGTNTTKLSQTTSLPSDSTGPTLSGHWRRNAANALRAGTSPVSICLLNPAARPLPHQLQP
jgi:hypothetical protein